MSASSWWYGVILFPLVTLAGFLSQFVSRIFTAVSTAPGDPNVGLGVGSFIIGAVLFWLGVLIGLVVFVCLIADLRTLREDEGWTPRRVWGVVGGIHLVGMVFIELLVISTTILSYYLYQRHVHVGKL